MATIYYLNWDQERERHGPATELFHKLNVEEVLDPEEQPGGSLTEDMFKQLYREVIDIDTESEDLEDVWTKWQRTGYTEGEQFTELRYCSRCSSYIEGSDEAVTHASQNHCYDPFEESGEPDYIQGVRSMSVGDVVEIDGNYYQAKNIGWEEIEVTR